MKTDEFLLFLEEIYSSKYKEDLNAIQRQMEGGKDPNGFGVSDLSEFLFEFLNKRFKAVSVAHQYILRFLVSLEANSRILASARLFSEFLKGVYGPQVLQFFLFVRFLVERELRTSFAEAFRNMSKVPESFYLTKEQSRRILQMSFGSEDNRVNDDITKRFFRKHHVRILLKDSKRTREASLRFG